MPFVRQARFWIALLAEVLLLVALRRYDDWRYESMPLRFVETAIFAGIAYFAAASFFAKLPAARATKVTFWTAALLLRLVVLPLAPSDDFWRYEWEGKVQNAGFNPYLLAPNDPALAPLRAEFPDWNQINHRDFSAIYPPGAELVFAAMSKMSASAIAYKLLFGAADLLAIALLLRLIGGQPRYADAAWYAWNPLVVYSFSGAAHFDSLMITAMLAGILFLLRGEEPGEERQRWFMAIGAATALGVAISIKLIPLLLLPLFAVALGRRAIALLISLAIPGGLSLLYGFPRVPIWQSLGKFVYVARLNDIFWWIIEDTIWPNRHQKNYQYNVIIIIAVVVVSLLFIRNWRRGLLWVMGTGLILSPVLHPWYCTWILPLAAWRKAFAWQVLGITLFAYYLFWDERLFALPWHAEPWLRGFILIPPIVAMLSAMARKSPGSGASNSIRSPAPG